MPPPAVYTEELPLKCNYCGHEPKSHPNRHFRESNLTRHIKDVHLEKDIKYICPDLACDASIGRLDNFKKHLSRKHPQLSGMTTAEAKGYRLET